MAALTRSGARKASEIVIFTLRTLHLSRLAMLSVVAVCSAISSSSQRRPRAIDATKVARFSERIGRACSVRQHLKPSQEIDDRGLVHTHVARVEVQPEQLIIQLAEAQGSDRQKAGALATFYQGQESHGAALILSFAKRPE
jgi:hypothetical protein